ncbi:hypothetical protein HGRIS_007433 [Hohenbuehelia grisea]|uniref:P-loop containing nucleoside triphosphate hydrolase protein n=1 Tax=Hohenbuehelia grisea TaxID=104357 RepID=A0ABR3J4T7_9AGAR
MGQDLSASKVFSSMTVFDMLRDQLHAVNGYISLMIQGKVSLDRLDAFLHETELLDDFTDKLATSGDENTEYSSRPTTTFYRPAIGYEDSIGFSSASFTWSAAGANDSSMTSSRSSVYTAVGASSPDSTFISSTPSRQFILRIEDELLFQKEGFNLIVGPTGSGKTSLLMALLGEMHFLPSGTTSWYQLPRASGVAYAAQESWVQNATIKENIVFETPFDEARYKKVIYQCCLERDLELFAARDDTEVGEKGLTLSGGQKARITLARAIYSRANTILLDDVLAALDVHTAKWIAEKCFSGDLIKGRTVILVTHNVALMRPIADFIVSLGLDGRIASQGSAKEVITKDATLAHLLEEDEKALERAEESLDDPKSVAPGDGITPNNPDGKLIAKEEVELGHVGWQSLQLYLRALGGRHPIPFYLVFMGGYVFVQGFVVFQTWFLGHWASQYDTHAAREVPVYYYLGIYALLMITIEVGFVIADVTFIFGTLRASRSLHRQLIVSVLGTTLRWLDVTPISRIVTRCTQDIRAVDGPIAQTLGWLSEMTVSIAFQFAAVVIFTPEFIGPGVLIAVLGGWCGQIYMAGQLSIKREMSNAKAPVVGHFDAAIAGLTSIRAYGAQNDFKTELRSRIDKYTRAARTNYNLNRWVCVRIDLLGCLFTSGLAAYLVYGRTQTAANTGFSLNMAVGFSSMILWWVRVFNEFEVQGNSLERIQGYVSIEQEPVATEDGKPPAYWPASGDLVAENLSARYSPEGPQVLKDISFSIKSGERVGVVGRTGSGKSSLTLSLLRCIFTEGNVYLDGRPTGAVNLDALRSSITIIPQVPELLSGTLRENLDPFSQYEDATLNDALRAAGLFSLQNKNDENRITLDTQISGGGANLSIGQRQIMTLARAIVRRSKVFILDEATSAIDYKTDSVIQSSLRSELGKDVTLITIAHRLQTIMDADKIMVLDAGRLVEFDSPAALLKNDKSKLRALVDESSDRDTLIAMVESKGA